MNCGQSCACADEDRGIAFLFDQFVDGHRPANHYVRLKLDAHLAHIVDLLAHNVPWLPAEHFRTGF